MLDLYSRGPASGAGPAVLWRETQGQKGGGGRGRGGGGGGASGSQSGGGAHHPLVQALRV